ncbi:MAG: hypothetical protein Q9181_007991 [Wetmoreana brouardii]
MDIPTDDATAAEILRLQLEDLETLSRTDGGVEDPDELSRDADVAVRTYRQQLLEQQSVLFDRHVARQTEGLGIHAGVNVPRDDGRDNSRVPAVRDDEATCTGDVLPAQPLSEDNTSSSAASLDAGPEPEDDEVEVSPTHDRASNNCPDLAPSTSCVAPEEEELINNLPDNAIEQGDADKNSNAVDSSEDGSCGTPPEAEAASSPIESSDTSTAFFSACSEVSRTFAEASKPHDQLSALEEREQQEPGYIAEAESQGHLLQGAGNLQFCVSCGEQDTGQDFADVACDHVYCRECLIAYCEASIGLTCTFPPQCCGLPMTLDVIQTHVPLDLSRRFTEYQDEMAGACLNLCAETTCKTLIPEGEIEGSKGHCIACNRLTCIKCKSPWHPGLPCAIDEGSEELMELAKEKDWQVCYRCGHMVELNMGCHHIVCVCKAEFCYVCGSQWKTCDCAQFRVDRILNRDEEAAGRVAREAERLLQNRAEWALGNRYHSRRRRGEAPDSRPRNVQLEEMRNLIRGGCLHGTWRISSCLVPDVHALLVGSAIGIFDRDSNRDSRLIQ